MNDQSTPTCLDEELGTLLFRYELGELSELERDRFEAHLLRCDFCLRQIQEKMPIMDAFLNYKAEISEQLRAEGLEYRLQKQKLKEQLRKKRGTNKSAESLWTKINEILAEIIRPKIWIPATAVSIALILLVFLPQGPQPENPYLFYLDFNKAPYQPLQPRLGNGSEAKGLFSSGMKAYLEEDYQGAINNLSKAVELSPQQGSWWLYLGICYYLNHQAQPAIEALSRADSLTDYALKNAARWYLAQAFLLAENPEQALPILKGLSEQKREYSASADSLVVKVQSIFQKKQK